MCLEGAMERHHCASRLDAGFLRKVTKLLRIKLCGAPVNFFIATTRAFFGKIEKAFLLSCFLSQSVSFERKKI
jgi:hypothetical protein